MSQSPLGRCPHGVGSNWSEVAVLAHAVVGAVALRTGPRVTRVRPDGEQADADWLPSERILEAKGATP